VADPESELRVEDALAGRVPERARPVDRSLGDAIDRLAGRLRDEVDSAELTVAGGDAVRIVDLSEVEQWLRGCAIRSRAGEAL
jgi:hypothetical protein